MTPDTLQWAALALSALAALAAVLAWLRKPSGVSAAELDAALQSVMQPVLNRLDRLERDVRQDLTEGHRSNRQELVQSLAAFGETVSRQAQETTRTQNAQLDGFAQQLVQLRGAVGDALTQQLQALSDANARRLAEVRETLEAQLVQQRQSTDQQQERQRLTLEQQLGQQRQAIEQLQLQLRQTLEQQVQALQASNAQKLDEMRATVDEKLQATLETRLGQSFKQVADRLEQVHKGLGEMQTLAQGVGDLKHLLSNVKTRGMFGEAQLAALLEQVLAPDQYATQVATRPGSKNLVDFAIRLPGRGDNGQPCWLPIDAKFPNEDYERLLDAQARAEPLEAEQAARGLEARIRQEAKSLADKYLEPPHTTDFAILFLPTEGLYAEVLRRPGLMEVLQRDHRVTLAGPTTLMAMLNSLQMGFRTLALEKRSSEVWQVLGAVKTEFGKFGDVLAKVKNQTQTVLNTLDSAEVRSRAMGRALKSVEALPVDQAQALLPVGSDDGDAGL